MRKKEQGYCHCGIIHDLPQGHYKKGCHKKQGTPVFSAGFPLLSCEQKNCAQQYDLSSHDQNSSQGAVYIAHGTVPDKYLHYIPYGYVCNTALPQYFTADCTLPAVQASDDICIRYKQECQGNISKIAGFSRVASKFNGLAKLPPAFLTLLSEVSENKLHIVSCHEH